MKPYLILSLTLYFIACQNPKQENTSQADTTATTPVKEEAANNALSEQQKAEGWKLLFNGQNIEGWRIFKNKENNSWEVQDGALHCKPDSLADKRADIMTTDQYENFELTFDWKISPNGNSGVMYRVTEEFNDPYLTGPEYQVFDDASAGKDTKDVQLTAANYDMHAAPKDKPLKPVGEWNTGKIVVNGNHVEHWLNGIKVVEYELGSEEWKKTKAGSKWKNEKGYGMAKKGHIDFQDHGNEVWYRNIMIKTL